MMIRVLIADDQVLFLRMLEEVLSKDVEIEIVGTATNGQAALDLAFKLNPDVVLMDIKMPEKSGIVALKELKIALPDSKVMMLTTFEDSETVMQSCQMGADGYLVKDIQPDVLIMAIKCVFNDLIVIHKSAYSMLCHHSDQAKLHSKERIVFGNVTLDGIDMHIVKLIAEGKTNKEIAHVLNYSEGTIKNRVSRILNLTGMTDRTQISVFAIKNNLI
jgi:DNA-binding NarL/FixJ family response regulator